jgi:uncharacterized protein
MPGTMTNGLQLASFEIRVNGKLLSSASAIQLIQVCVEEDVNLPSMFTLEFAGLEDQASGIFLIDDQQFDLGSAVQVKMGYHNHLAVVVEGEITGLEPEFQTHCAPSLTVRGYDRRHRLHRGRKTRTFVKLKDSDIAAQLASDVGISTNVVDSQVTHEYVMQANQSDWQFLRSRADRIGYEITMEAQTLHFQPTANAQSPKLTLSGLDDLLEFSPRLSTLGQVTEVAVQGWDIKDKKAITATSGQESTKMGGKSTGADLSQKAFGAAVRTATDLPSHSQAESDQAAKAGFNQSILQLITGEGVCYGRPDLRVGIVIAITGIGKRFSGNYYVMTVRHQYNGSGYYTYFTVRRNAL